MATSAQYEVFLGEMPRLTDTPCSKEAIQLNGYLHRQRYLELSDRVFPEIAQLLTQATGHVLSLTAILEPQLRESEEWRLHPNRLVSWDWKDILHKFRKKPKRMDVAFYCGGVLCGLMTAGISRGKVSINIRYLEANPDPLHPLKGSFLFVALMQAELFAQFVNCTKVSVSRPAPDLVDRYKAFEYKMVVSDLKRVARGVQPKHSLLVKELIPAF